MVIMKFKCIGPNLVNKYIISLAIILMLSACNRIPTFEHWSKGLIGIKIEVLKETINRKGSYASQIGWKERTYTLENGNWVYVFPVFEDCLVHAEVNPEGIVINFWTEGQHCS